MGQRASSGVRWLGFCLSVTHTYFFESVCVYSMSCRGTLGTSVSSSLK